MRALLVIYKEGNEKIIEFRFKGLTEKQTFLKIEQVTTRKRINSEKFAQGFLNLVDAITKVADDYLISLTIDKLMNKILKRS